MPSKSSDGPLFANLKDSDPALIQAIKEAKNTFPHFLKARAKKRFPEAAYCVKMPFIDRSKTRKQALIQTPETAAKHPKAPICHLWLLVHSLLEELLFCHVTEAPKELKLPPGTSFVATDESIEDWMINDDGIVYGGFSLRVMRNRMAKTERAEFDSHTGIRAFKKL